MEKDLKFSESDIGYHFERVLSDDNFQLDVVELMDAYDSYYCDDDNETLKSYWFRLFKNYYVKVANNYIEKNDCDPNLIQSLVDNFKIIVDDCEDAFKNYVNDYETLKDRLDNIYKVYFCTCANIFCMENDLSDEITTKLAFKVDDDISDMQFNLSENDCILDDDKDEDSIKEQWYVIFKLYLAKQAKLYSNNKEKLEENIKILNDAIIDTFTFMMNDLEDAFKNCMYSDFINEDDLYDLFKKYFIQCAKYYCYKKGLSQELAKLIVDRFDVVNGALMNLNDYRDIMEQWKRCESDDEDEFEDEDNDDVDELPFG